MKKIKLLTPILGVTAIGAGIVPVVTSCSSATKIVPIDLLNIVGQTLKGFKKDADVSKYDTLVIPEGIKIIDDEAFKDVFVVGTKSGFINQIVMPTTLTQIKSKAFSGCNSLRVLDFSKWTVDHIYYATFANDAFEGALPGGQTVFHDGISSESKDKLTGMLANAGVGPSWSLDETSDKITADSVWLEQKTKFGKADYLFRLNVELKSSYRLIATTSYISGSEGISVTDEVETQYKFLEIKDGILKVPAILINQVKAGDYANFNITFTCVDIEAQKPVWKQSLKGFKLINATNLATELKLECDQTTIDEGKTTTIKATVGKEDAEDKTVSFKSSNESVATVDANGVVTGVKHGTATITVTANGGLHLVKTMDITVKAIITKLEANTAGATLKFKVGETFSSAGLKLNATWSDGSTSTIESGFTTNYDNHKFEESEIGTGKTVIVTYLGKTCEYTINVEAEGYNETVIIGADGVAHEVDMTSICAFMGNIKSKDGKIDIPREDFNLPVAIGKNEEEIGDNFLSQCSSFNQEIAIPTSVKKVGSLFLCGCTSFDKPITIPASVTSIGAAFLNMGIQENNSIFNSTITFAEGSQLETIGIQFLTGCRLFNKPITIPASVTSIGDFFISMNNITNPAFNSSITFAKGSQLEIGKYFLSSCSNFNNTIDFTTLDQSKTTFGDNMLDNVPDTNTLTFKVANGTKSDWESKLKTATKKTAEGAWPATWVIQEA